MVYCLWGAQVGVELCLLPCWAGLKLDSLLSQPPPIHSQKAIRGQEGLEIRGSCRTGGAGSSRGDFPSARTSPLPGLWSVVAQLESRKVRGQSSFLGLYTKIPPSPELTGSWVEMERAWREPETEIRYERMRVLIPCWIPELQ